MIARNGPLVSVITPTYNRAKFIGQAVQSVLNQTYGNFEHLIVDDGSTDNTGEVLKPFLSDERVRYFHQQNQGQSVARNLGIRHARGELVCFIDSDDIWVAHKLTGQVRLMDEHPEVGIIHGDEIMIDEAGQEFSRKNMKRYSGNIADQLLVDNSVSINTAMVRRECLSFSGGFPQQYGVADDYALWLRLSARYRFLYVPEFFGYYRVMENQISSDVRRRLTVNERIVWDFLEEYPDVLPQAVRRRSLARFYSRKARILGALGERRQAIGAFAKALNYAPVSVGVWRSGYRVLAPRT